MASTPLTPAESLSAARKRQKGYSIWKEDRFGKPGYRIRTGKRRFGSEQKKWFATRKEAEQWVQAKIERHKQIGQSEWAPTRSELLELEKVMLRLKQAQLEGLPLPPLPVIVDTAIAKSREDSGRRSMTLAQVLDGWKAAKSKKSGQHVQKCMNVYKRFATWFGVDRSIREVNTEQAEAWIRSLEVIENTRTRYKLRLSGLWQWAAKPQRKWVDDDPWLAVETEPLTHSRPVPLSIEQVKALLRTAAREENVSMLPPLVLTLFAGPRIAEARRLSWDDIVLDPGEEYVRLDPEHTKTGSRRASPLPAVAVAWLKYFPGEKAGLVSPGSWNFRRERLLAQAGFRVKAKASNNGEVTVKPLDGIVRWDWPRNGLRKSYCTYAVAETRDLAEVAFRAGNSVQVLRRDYVALVNTKAAKEYFALTPAVVLGAAP